MWHSLCSVAECRYADCHLCWISFMLRGAYKPFVLSVFMLCILILSILATIKVLQEQKIKKKKLCGLIKTAKIDNDFYFVEWRDNSEHLKNHKILTFVVMCLSHSILINIKAKEERQGRYDTHHNDIQHTKFVKLWLCQTHFQPRAGLGNWDIWSGTNYSVYFESNWYE